MLLCSFPSLPGSFAQRVDATPQINNFVVCLVNTLIHWIVIYLVDSVIYPLMIAPANDSESFHHHHNHGVIINLIYPRISYRVVLVLMFPNYKNSAILIHAVVFKHPFTKLNRK